MRVNREPYTVPAIRVLICVFPSSFNFAKPKSEILALRSLSSNTLLAFISLCTIFILDSSWRNVSPLAIPKKIFFLVDQSSFSLELSSFPAKENHPHRDFEHSCHQIHGFIYFPQLRTRQKETYQIAHEIDSCSPNTHTPISIGFLQHNIHIASQDLDVVELRSFLFHLQTRGFPAWILRTVV